MIKLPVCKHLSIIVFCALFLLPIESIGSEELAKLPYDRLLQVQDSALKNLSNDHPFYLHIFSSDPQIKNTDISLHLVSVDEKVEIPLDKRGFIELPIRRDLVGKGAYVISNQPKGTMVLQGESRSQVPLKNRRIDYKDLISPVIAANSASKLSKDIPEITAERYISSINLYVDYSGNEPVTIGTLGQEIINLFPDACGNVLIPIEDNLLTENPIVEFPSNEIFYIHSIK